MTLDKVALPTLPEVEETNLPCKSHDTVILQPKFDGCQAILFPTAEGYVPVTRKGNVIIRLLPFCQAISAALSRLGDFVFFCEYEPEPWSEEAKSKLTANLYNDRPLSFSTRLTVFDACRVTDLELMRKQECRTRLIALQQLSTPLQDLQLHVTPFIELPYGEALKLCESARQLDPSSQAIRSLILGHYCEGGVIRWQHRAQKVKPTFEIDAAVLEALASSKGQRAWLVVDTKKPNSEPFPVFGGVTEENHKALLGRVVELKLLAVSNAKGGGNPTFQRDRGNEKEFDVPAYKEKNSSAILAAKQKYKLS